MQTADLIPADWASVQTFDLQSRSATYRSIDHLALPSQVDAFLRAAYPGGIYAHQADAVKRVLSGEHVCLATSTASGKTLAFQIAGLAHLATNSRARVLALYPQRALGNAQEQRWRDALAKAEIPGSVGRIDGSVSSALRAGILRSSRVIVATPDVLHAWFLSHLTDSSIRNFLSGLTLVVADEVHTYTGVIGSNAAYLFRRLQHAARLLGSRPQFFAASATIRDPLKHLDLLFGLPFALVGPDADTSPKQSVHVTMIEPPHAADFLTEVTGLMRHLVDNTTSRFLAFVDSRKQTEHIASILARRDTVSPDNEGEPDEDVAAKPTSAVGLDILETAEVLPYRSGYEEHDREVIEQRLASGNVRGVVSTSALELGLDIGSLDVVVLIGVPRSSTSLHQRIGRVGRSRPGCVLVVNSGEVYDEAVFRVPERLLDRPPAEGALYLENARIQYIHALCLGRLGGEHDQSSGTSAQTDDAFASDVSWPPGFLDLCRAERTGQIPTELQAMKAEAGDTPNLVFPLRDVESQFKLELRSGPVREPKGSLSHGQLLREAYPGAVYYYATRPLRVVDVAMRTRTVTLRREKRYTTRPTLLPTAVYPNLGVGNVFRGIDTAELRRLECNLQIREAVLGYRERRGGNDFSVSYPLDQNQGGIVFRSPRFARNYFTTGTVLVYPEFDRDPRATESFATFLYEALLMAAPYERQDVGVGVDKVRVEDGPLPFGRRFVAIYDQTYGSLRLSGRLMESDVFASVVRLAAELAENDESGNVYEGTALLARVVCAAAECPATNFTHYDGGPNAPRDEDRLRVIMPGSYGVDGANGNAEFYVEGVAFVPKLGCVSYRGRYGTGRVVAGQVTMIRHEALLEIPGESQMGWYRMDTGETTAIVGDDKSSFDAL